MLLTLSWTALYGQTGDSLTCYTNAEMKRIAVTVVYANECDTLLKIAILKDSLKQVKLNNQSLIIDLRDSTISVKDSILNKHVDITAIKEEEIIDLQDANKTLSNRLLATKVMWAGSIGGLLILWVLTSLP